MTDIPYEIERKLLIEYPDVKLLSELCGVEIREIVQTYLLCSTGSLRVRKTVTNGNTVYHKNEKRRISDMTHEEYESEINFAQYTELLKLCDSSRRPIEKTRYAFPYMGHIIEIDVYPFWNDRAILEVELSDESEKFDIPPFVKVIKDVTGDGHYSNKALALEIVNEKI